MYGLSQDEIDFIVNVSNIAVRDEYDLDRALGIFEEHDGSISVKKDVDLSRMGLTKITVPFSSAYEDFNVSRNKLRSLEGCPDYVGGDFECQHNKLTTLFGGPIEVSGHYDCRDNRLKSITSLPLFIGGNLVIAGNDLGDNLEEEIHRIGIDIGGEIIY
jgi:hypothetical protein